MPTVTLRPDKPQTEAAGNVLTAKIVSGVRKIRNTSANNRDYHTRYYMDADNRQKAIEGAHRYYEANAAEVLLRQSVRYRQRKLDPAGYAEHRLLREIQRLDDWEEIRKGLVPPKGKRRSPL